MFLLVAAIEASYETNQWATFKQWKAAGQTVVKGQESTAGFFLKPLLVDVKKNGSQVLDGNGNPVRRTIWVHNMFRLFNKAQTEAVSDAIQTDLYGEILTDEVVIPTKIDTAETYFSGLGADIQPGNPAYSPATDTVFMPNIEDFDAVDAYYGTLAHEMTHWTGHKSRLDRPKHVRWGDAAYAYEELIAEFGSVFLSSKLGMSAIPRPDHAQYLASWIKGLRSDPKAVWSAASAAERAVRHMDSIVAE